MIRTTNHLSLVAGVVLLNASFAFADVQVQKRHVSSTVATPAFRFDGLKQPLSSDLAEAGEWSVVDGRLDANGGPVKRLSDGVVPRVADEPGENVFFAAGSAGGRLRLDLKRKVEIGHIASYSWHPAERGPQVYSLYGSDGTAKGFDPAPKRATDPATVGWTKIAEVDTRPDTGKPGGQYGVNIRGDNAAIGAYRYLLWDVRVTRPNARFAHTFFSEIDVATADGGTQIATVRPLKEVLKVTFGDEKQYEATFDTTAAPAFSTWVEEELAPVVESWYPRIVKMLPSENYTAPKAFTITFDPKYRGVAATRGVHVVCSPTWFRGQLEREAKGAVVHELVHVVQQYWRRPARGKRRNPVPGWVTEGVADYIRWHLYEEQPNKTEPSLRAGRRDRYDAGYRPSAKFIAWVQIKYKQDLFKELNAVARDGKYDERFWKHATGHTLTKLVNEWSGGGN